MLGLSVNDSKEQIVFTIDKNNFTEEVFDKEGYDLAQKEYRAEEQRIHLLFQRTLFEEFGVANNPKREACFSLAWEHGHSSGYDEIYNYFSEFVELIT